MSEQPSKPHGQVRADAESIPQESEKLYPHLIEIEETAQRRLEQMMPQLEEAAGVSEQLKASDPMQWVGLMNSCKAQAEEILLAELIHS